MTRGVNSPRMRSSVASNKLRLPKVEVARNEAILMAEDESLVTSSLKGFGEQSSMKKSILTSISLLLTPKMAYRDTSTSTIKKDFTNPSGI